MADNVPVALVYNMPCCVLASVAKQKVLLLGLSSSGTAIVFAAFGWVSLLLIPTGSHLILLSFFLMLLVFGLGCLMRLFGVAGDDAKYRCMSSGFMRGIPLSCP